ncbi:serine/arginine repetitive matrix protein 2-like [Quillaja saponaria]|uniref:Serine/arginine repetitive matrix protein 2-like n=1 Tax=Quillaja saponaria TaxID=32244 RepID=A0AAD7PQD4_QUISA|nr:serine/arginine repetitive matrix protein 2-like [Quillaja saponaria]
MPFSFNVEDLAEAHLKVNAIGTEDDEIAAEKRRQHRQRHRESPRSSSKGRRRTPSREREQQQRSSSRERRVSRSPGRRASESTTPANTASANASNNTSSRPGKMVSVPATVSSLVMDKSNNGGGGEPATTTGIKRISVKRNVGDTGVMGSRSAASPRSQSPSRTNGKVSNDNQLQQPSLSRNSSRKAEHSPCRRNPLSEIDPNILAYPQPSNNNSSKVQNRAKKELGEANQKPNVDIVQGTHHRTRSRGSMEKVVSVDGKSKEQQQADAKGQSSMTDNIVVKTVVASGVDNLKPQTLTRTRSSRRSRDLDLDPEALLNSTPSYTKLLLEDIHNFHQKNTPSVSLPACVTKACSILEAVADLNSTTSSKFSSAISEDKKSPLTYQTNRNDFNLSLGVNHFHKKMPEAIDPFVESEIVVSDDVMEPSFHKYITVRRGGALGGADMEDQESSGSNSFVASGQQNWGFHSSAWEPNSADSTDCLTSRLNNREEDQKSPNGFDGNLLSEAGPDSYEARRKLNSKRRENDHRHSSGIGRGRLGASNGSKGGHMIPVVAATAST